MKLSPRLTFCLFLTLTLFVCAELPGLFRMDGTEFQDYDLGARIFGAGLGAVYGFLTGVSCWLVTLLANRSIGSRRPPGGGELPNDDPSSRLCRPKVGSYLRCRLLYAAYFLMFVLLATAVSAYVGHETGKCVDLDYYLAATSAENAASVPTHLPLRFFLILLPVLASLSIARMFRVSEDQTHASAYAIRTIIRVSFVVLCLAAVSYNTERLTRPNLTLRPTEPEEGIYVYSNDTVYNVSPLNIYSSRLQGFEHTGLCLITRRPGEINAQRSARGEEWLRFQALDDGYYIHALNLKVADRDGVTNHGGRTSLSDAPYPFDIDAFNHFLAGRSANDRLKPAMKLYRVELADPRTAWDAVARFRDEFNKKYPEGFIYSPVPYRAKYVTLYNCNTVTAAILGEILGQGNRYDFVTAMRGCPGGQTAEDGKKWLEDMMAHDRNPDIARQREWMATEPFSKQAFFHRLMHREGWVYSLAGDWRDEDSVE